MPKFFEFSNKNDSVNELYVYGEIIGGATKWDESDVTFKDFQDSLDNIKSNSTLEMYISSPGGDVFTTQSIISMIDRCKSKKNIKVIAYIDGLAASCGSWLPMVADEIVVYSNSIMMLHKPFTMMMGNADDMEKEVDVLNKLENDVMIPMYMRKAKNLTEDKLKDMLAKETWLSVKEIVDIFNVTYIEENKQISAKLNEDSIKNFKNMPDNLKKSFLNSLSGAKDHEEKNEDEKPVMSEATKNLIERINSKKDFWRL